MPFKKIRYYLYLTLGLSLQFLACKETPKTTVVRNFDTLTIGTQTYWMEPISEKDFNAIATIEEDTSEYKNILAYANMVYRNGDTLFLKKSNGTYVQMIENHSDGDSFVNYSYRYYLKNINYYVVYAGFYESYSYCLINKNSGHISYCAGPPTVSPNLSQILSANADLIANFTFNGFELYQVEKDSLKLIEAKELDHWGPERIKWKLNDEILVEQSIFDTTKESLIRTNYIKLKAKQ